MKDFIVVGSTRIGVQELLARTSNDLYQTDLHYRICERAAERFCSDKDERKFLTNLFALKSTPVRAATAISYYLKNNPSPITEIRMNALTYSLIDPPLSVGENSKCVVSEKWSLVDRQHIYRLFFKVILHRLFRLLSGRVNESKTIVRAWVEVSARMYPGEVIEGSVLVYPFGFFGMRQIRFIYWCITNNVRFKFCGLPYSIVKFALLVIKNCPHHKILWIIEQDANRRHGRELLKLQPRRILTSDEFECGSFILYGQVMQAGVEVINTAHGVGQYCPYVSYSEFRVLGDQQSKFYSERNPYIRYVKTESHAQNSFGLEVAADSLYKPIAVVLIHQPFAVSGMIAEEMALRKIDMDLADICMELKLPYLVKLHPNSASGRLFRSGYSFLGVPIAKWLDINEFKGIFVGINSTVISDLVGLSPVLVYSGPTFFPVLYFDNDLLTFSDRDQLSQLIKQLVDSGNRKPAAHQDGASNSKDACHD